MSRANNWWPSTDTWFLGLIIYTDYVNIIETNILKHNLFLSAWSSNPMFGIGKNYTHMRYNNVVISQTWWLNMT